MLKPVESYNTRRKSRRITSGQNQFRTEQREGDIADICVFTQIAYSRVQEKATDVFKRNLLIKKYSTFLNYILVLMFSRMNRLAVLFVNESNFFSFIDGSEVVFGTEKKVPAGGCQIVYDWKTVCSTRSQSFVDNFSIQELCTHSVECIGGQVNYILQHPYDRILKPGFYDEQEETITRYLVDHGYIFLCISTDEEQIIEKSRFKEIIMDNEEIEERLLQCCRYNIGNRKRQLKKTFLIRLGYVTDKGKILCHCQTTNDTRTDDEGGVSCVQQVECSECQRHSAKLSRRSSSGCLQTNWWRTAKHEELRKNASVIEDGEENQRPLGQNNIFKNKVAIDCFRRFHEYDSTSPIVHNVYTSVVNLVRMDAWMTVCLLYIAREGFKPRKGGNNIHRLVNDYDNMKMSAYTQFQKEVCSILRYNLRESQQLEAFEKELNVRSGDTGEEICSNVQRQFTFAVPVDEESPSEYLIYVKPNVFKERICSWLGQVKDCVIGKVLKDSSGEWKFKYIE